MDKKINKNKSNKKLDLTVYPVNIDMTRLGEIKKDSHLCSIPHLILIVGRVKAGKSTLLNNLYLSENFYKNDYQVKILISPSAHNDVMYQHMINEFDYVFTEYTDELIDELLDIINSDDSKDKYLIIFDDIVGSSVGSKKGKPDRITQLSTMYRHVGNENSEGKLSIVITTQYFKYITPILRNQCSGVYICGSFSDSELNKISEAYEFFGGSKKAFINLHKQSRQGPFDFLFLNVHSMLALRNHTDVLWSYEDSIKSFNKDNEDYETDSE
jgi:hypothetical protein